jgi:hypothetical protein
MTNFPHDESWANDLDDIFTIFLTRNTIHPIDPTANHPKSCDYTLEFLYLNELYR